MCENGNWFGRNLYDKIMMEYDYSDQLEIVTIEKITLTFLVIEKIFEFNINKNEFTVINTK